MMMHAQDFRTDRYGMVTGLREGGYSDDMTLAAVAGANGRMISSPERAVFFHPLAANLSFSRYWNYLRKQTIVLETYNTTFNFWMNRGLFSVHCWLSWSFVFPYVTTLVHLVVALRAFVSTSFDSFPSCSIGWLFVSLTCPPFFFLTLSPHMWMLASKVFFLLCLNPTQFDCIFVCCVVGVLICFGRELS
jgi:hypothetical protein